MNGNMVLVAYLTLLFICVLSGILSGGMWARKYKSSRKWLWFTGGGLFGGLVVFPLILVWLGFG